MVIDYFNFERVALLETEADSPLVIDPDAPLALAVVLQRFQAVRGRNAQILQRRRRIELGQPHCRPFPDLGRQPPGFPRNEEALRFDRSKRANHEKSVNYLFTIVKSLRFGRAEADNFRWRIEELRVSLFAQELKTPYPVSFKRLDKLWSELTRT